MKDKVCDFYVIAYVSVLTGKQIVKPFEDNVNGTLKPVAIFNVYLKVN